MCNYKNLLCSDLKMSFEEKLIENVRNKRVLWDKKDTNYKNRFKKTKAWKQIAEIMGYPGNNF